MLIGPLNCVKLMRSKSSCFWVLKLKPDFNDSTEAGAETFQSGLSSFSLSTSHRRLSSSCCWRISALPLTQLPWQQKWIHPPSLYDPLNNEKWQCPTHAPINRFWKKKKEIKKRIQDFPALKMKPPLIKQVLNALSNIIRWSKDLRCELTLL